MAPARKTCTEVGCNKQAASGGLCVSHGGGKLCQYEGCTKGYQRGGFCRKHGGGSRCTMPFCNKVDAGRGLCRSHGGGKRCKAPECTKADVGGGFCTAHGGGKRCGFPLCKKNNQGGGYCRAHGGGRRCSEPGCVKMGKGPTGKCPDHGGAQVCKTPNCRKIARNAQGYCRDHGDVEDVILSDTSYSTSPRPRAMSMLTMAMSMEPSLSFNYRRLLIQAQLHGLWTESRVLSVLKAEAGVRSVHILGYRPSLSRLPKTSACFVVRGDLKASSLISALDGLHIPSVLLEDNAVDDANIAVEITLAVNGMMCMESCGNRVLRAVQKSPMVQQAHLDFEAAQLVVSSGNISMHALISTIQAVGFEANVVSARPVPNQLRFQVHPVSKKQLTAEAVKLLSEALSHVEGVEDILFIAESAELVASGFFDENEIVLVAATMNVTLLVSPTRQDTAETQLPLATADAFTTESTLHDCGLSSAETSECMKYRTVMAHTAALAVGWAVPGCGMAFGFECSCGNACKCPGCPMHNPGQEHSSRSFR
ncbi:unnamed protein product [Aphanomyces euteiches]|uniref:HMA domain-containing protein n=1 Tax=Aphanomyces euteiches TaxID=100861 RepID=A0A6G0XMK7_9STRA|nr:hypothetical protein Ae201684_003292 [Aphanomyces euteiches]KAH9098454.1 hypothetical protein Ae201684P_017666 [Aphanomyces euteiches]